MNLQKYKKKSKKTLAVGRVDTEDMEILKRNGINVSMIIYDAIKKAAKTIKE
jgi:post-segregation antitoxin (ccd killing protein)